MSSSWKVLRWPLISSTLQRTRGAAGLARRFSQNATTIDEQAAVFRSERAERLNRLIGISQDELNELSVRRLDRARYNLFRRAPYLLKNTVFGHFRYLSSNQFVTMLGSLLYPSRVQVDIPTFMKGSEYSLLRVYSALFSESLLLYSNGEVEMCEEVEFLREVAAFDDFDTLLAKLKECRKLGVDRFINEMKPLYPHLIHAYYSERSTNDEDEQECQEYLTFFSRYYVKGNIKAVVDGDKLMITTLNDYGNFIFRSEVTSAQVVDWKISLEYFFQFLDSAIIRHRKIQEQPVSAKIY